MQTVPWHRDPVVSSRPAMSEARAMGHENESRQGIGYIYKIIGIPGSKSAVSQ
jgi:hypothetical protein